MGLYGYVFDFSVDYDRFDFDDKYSSIFNEKTQWKTMVRIIKHVLFTLLSFGGSLSSMVNFSNFTKCIFLTNQPYMTRLTLNDLNPYEYKQGCFTIYLWLI